MTTPVTTPVRRWWRHSQAPAGIFGTIVGASVLAAVDDDTPLSDVAVALIVTLVIYWLAERWSELLGSNLRGQPLTRRRIIAVFGQGWPMVQASYTPLAVLLVCWAIGVSDLAAMNLALLASVVMLVSLGVAAGRRAGFRVWGTVGSGLFTGVLGMFLILLKAILH